MNSRARASDARPGRATMSRLSSTIWSRIGRRLPADASLNLAVFRIVVALLFLATGEVRDAPAWATLSPALAVAPRGWGWALALFPPNAVAARAASLAVIAGAVLGAAGLFARAAFTVLVVAALYLLALPLRNGMPYHYQHLVWFAAICAASPCAIALALDVWRRRRVEPPPPRSPAYGVPLRVAWLLVGVISFSGAVEAAHPRAGLDRQRQPPQPDVLEVGVDAGLHAAVPHRSSARAVARRRRRGGDAGAVVRIRDLDALVAVCGNRRRTGVPRIGACSWASSFRGCGSATWFSSTGMGSRAVGSAGPTRRCDLRRRRCHASRPRCAGALLVAGTVEAGARGRSAAGRSPATRPSRMARRRAFRRWRSTCARRRDEVPIDVAASGPPTRRATGSLEPPCSPDGRTDRPCVCRLLAGLSARTRAGERWPDLRGVRFYPPKCRRFPRSATVAAPARARFESPLERPPTMMPRARSGAITLSSSADAANVK